MTLPSPTIPPIPRVFGHSRTPSNAPASSGVPSGAETARRPSGVPPMIPMLPPANAANLTAGLQQMSSSPLASGSVGYAEDDWDTQRANRRRSSHESESDVLREMWVAGVPAPSSSRPDHPSAHAS